MTVKEWKRELECYGDDMEVVFEFSDNIEVDSWTEDRCGNKSVYIDATLMENFVSEYHGKCHVELMVEEQA